MSTEDLILTISIVIMANLIQTIVIYRFAATRNWPRIIREWMTNEKNADETKELINAFMVKATEAENVQRAVDYLLDAAANTIKARIAGAVGGTVKALNRAVQKEALQLAKEQGLDVEPALAIEKAVETLERKNPMLASLAQMALTRMMTASSPPGSPGQIPGLPPGGNNGHYTGGWG